jgi:hypothetical protein
MADSHTPSYEMDSRRAAPPYRESSQHGVYDFGDALRPAQRSVLEYGNNSAFQYNRSIPEFSADAVASGIPPLPIYQHHDPPSYPYPHETLGQSDRYDPLGSHNSYLELSTRSTYQLPSQNRPSEVVMRQSSYRPTGRVVEEGELSEGEFEETPLERDPNRASPYRGQPFIEKGRYGSKYGTVYDRGARDEASNTTPLTGKPVIFDIAMESNRVLRYVRSFDKFKSAAF